MHKLEELLMNPQAWSAPAIGSDIPRGDMPGDKVDISHDHITKSKLVFAELLRQLPEVMKNSKDHKIVIAVCGGSGVGKTGIAALISYYFNQLGIGSYTLSGDNYPRRIPKYNDAERLRMFRQGGVRALVQADMMNDEVFRALHELQEQEKDADTDYIDKYSWFKTYLDGAIEGLSGYLGTIQEIDFSEMTELVAEFKRGADSVWLKRMGRTECDLWYEKIDFSKINILVIEWTHGNSDYYEGVDLPVYLNSTPEETLIYRTIRNRDGNTDSPFTSRVLEIEQRMLDSQAHKAKVILSKSGELLMFEQYLALT
ncbi:adenylylsulfate kinase [Paenibacillus sp. FSL R7-0337]|uniref:adenylylsulfate kinase n=1 Tax=Paenibacillus sp. FSL R7-0337 TaxID=1926588 RepID=UPI0009F902A9|nr:adenylylsulfate kinase [Paenibacillus sp. FSL R7-0337]